MHGLPPGRRARALLDRDALGARRRSRLERIPCLGQGASYLSDDPRTCVNCHIMREQFDGWQKASHHAFATCNDCHVPHDFIGKWLTKAANGYHHSKAFTLQNFREPIRIRPVNAAVLNANCLYCHARFVGEITAHRVIDDEELYCVR